MISKMVSESYELCVLCIYFVSKSRSDIGVCKELNGIGPPQGMGLKKNYSSVVLLSTTALKK